MCGCFWMLDEWKIYAYKYYEMYERIVLLYEYILHNTKNAIFSAIVGMF